MKIAINTRLLLKGKLEGIGWFTCETLRRITEQHPEHQFYFLFDRPYDKDFVFGPNVTPMYAGPPARHPVLWYLWFQWTIPAMLRKIKPDIFVSPDGYLPLGGKVKKLAVIHDIAYEHFPDTVPGLVYKYYHYFFPRFAKEADLIATVSEYSKKDIASFYYVPEEKIRVVYNGCNTAFHPVSEAEKIATKTKWTDGKPYFVYLGGMYLRKNLKRLLEAFELFKKQDTQGTKLVLIGKRAFKADELDILREKSPYKEDIVFTGRIDDQEEVNRLVATSLAMTYVSIFEGFGIPCLEAMMSGTAVITSNTSSLPEVCGEAALYVDPYSVESIAQGMQQMAFNPEIRQELIAKGAKQAQKFSWQRTADLLWQAIEEALKIN